MLDHCDFDEQQHDLQRQTTIAGIRPDVIVTLPGGKHVVVDAKVPLDAYLRALEAPDEAARQALLADHARQVRTHLTQLARRATSRTCRLSPDSSSCSCPARCSSAPRSSRIRRSSSSASSSAACHSGQPDDADRAAARGGVRLAAGGDGGERAQDQRARAESLRVGAHARRALRHARARGSSRASMRTTRPSDRSKATCWSRRASSRSCRRRTAARRSSRSSRSIACRGCCRRAELTDGLPFDPGEASDTAELPPVAETV